MTTQWPSSIVNAHIEAHLKAHPEIKAVVSFDAGGVSGHANHTSIHAALQRAVSSGHDWISGLEVWALQTHDLSLKFTGIFGAALLSLQQPATPSSSTRVISCSVTGWAMGWRAMACHWSQLVWFRYAYLLFSTYMWVNVLHRVVKRQER